MPKQPMEIFMPPNILKAKIGGFGGIDMAALARAEAAVEELQDEFPDWMKALSERLADCHRAYAASPGEVTRNDLHRASHEVKGQAATFGFPLAARAAASLCDLLDLRVRPAPLIAAHVDAIAVIVRDEVRDEADPTALILIQELERRYTELRALETGF
jgi:HPt (histidine-containing phosphotransfer) domain-containing protein